MLSLIPVNYCSLFSGSLPLPHSPINFLLAPYFSPFPNQFSMAPYRSPFPNQFSTGSLPLPIPQLIFHWLLTAPHSPSFFILYQPSVRPFACPISQSREASPCYRLFLTAISLPSGHCFSCLAIFLPSSHCFSCSDSSAFSSRSGRRSKVRCKACSLRHAAIFL